MARSGSPPAEVVSKSSTVVRTMSTPALAAVSRAAGLVGSKTRSGQRRLGVPGGVRHDEQQPRLVVDRQAGAARAVGLRAVVGGELGDRLLVVERGDELVPVHVVGGMS